MPTTRKASPATVAKATVSKPEASVQTEATISTGTVANAVDLANSVTLTQQTRDLVYAEKVDAAKLRGVLRASVGFWRDADRMSLIGEMARTTAAANIVRQTDVLSAVTGEKITADDIAEMLPKADGSKVAPSSVTRWRDLATLLFDKGYSPDSAEFRILARGGANVPEVKAVIKRSGSTEAEITAELEKHFRLSDGLKYNSVQRAKLAKAITEGRTDEAETLVRGFDREAEPRQARTATASGKGAASILAEPEDAKPKVGIPAGGDNGKVLALMLTLVEKLDALTPEQATLAEKIADALADLTVRSREA